MPMGRKPSTYKMTYMRTKRNNCPPPVKSHKKENFSMCKI